MEHRGVARIDRQLGRREVRAEGAVAGLGEDQPVVGGLPGPAAVAALEHPRVAGADVDPPRIDGMDGDGGRGVRRRGAHAGPGGAAITALVQSGKGAREDAERAPRVPGQGGHILQGRLLPEAPAVPAPQQGSLGDVGREAAGGEECGLAAGHGQDGTENNLGDPLLHGSPGDAAVGAANGAVRSQGVEEAGDGVATQEIRHQFPGQPFPDGPGGSPVLGDVEPPPAEGPDLQVVAGVHHQEETEVRVRERDRSPGEPAVVAAHAGRLRRKEALRRPGVERCRPRRGDLDPVKTETADLADGAPVGAEVGGLPEAGAAGDVKDVRVSRIERESVDLAAGSEARDGLPGNAAVIAPIEDLPIRGPERVPDPRIGDEQVEIQLAERQAIDLGPGPAAVGALAQRLAGCEVDQCPERAGGEGIRSQRKDEGAVEPRVDGSPPASPVRALPEARAVVPEIDQVKGGGRERVQHELVASGEAPDPWRAGGGPEAVTGLNGDREGEEGQDEECQDVSHGLTVYPRT